MGAIETSSWLWPAFVSSVPHFPSLFALAVLCVLPFKKMQARIILNLLSRAAWSCSTLKTWYIKGAASPLRCRICVWDGIRGWRGETKSSKPSSNVVRAVPSSKLSPESSSSWHTISIEWNSKLQKERWKRSVWKWIKWKICNSLAPFCPSDLSALASSLRRRRHCRLSSSTHEKNLKLQWSRRKFYI